MVAVASRRRVAGSLVIVLCLLVVAQPILADTIYFKNGTLVNGTIVSQSTSMITVQTPAGNFTYSVAEIQRIEYGAAQSYPPSTQQPTAAPYGASGSQPVVVVQQQQQQQSGLGLSALTMEQEWNNAVFLGIQQMRAICEPPFADRLIRLGSFLLGSAMFIGCSVLFAWAGGFAGMIENEMGGDGAAIVFGIPVGLVLLLFPLHFWLTQPAKCREARQELAALEAIGRQRGWTYIGKFIPPPSLGVSVVVKEEDTLLDWLKFFQTLRGG